MGKTKPELSKAQHKALVAFSKLGAPSLDEWSMAMGMVYTTAVYYRRVLGEKGFMTSEPGKARTTRLTEKASKYLKEGGG